MNSHAIAVDKAVSKTLPSFDVQAFIQQAQDKTLAHLPMEFVYQVDGFNPRRYRDPVQFEDFKKKIKNEGVNQPIIVRPNPEKTGFEVIAGNGRYEASIEAQHPTIPVTIRFLNDEQALAISLSENLDRSDMSPIEESEAARRMLGLCNGDKAAAVEALDWDQQFFDRRIALLHCTDTVKEALLKGHIKLGHAELLAGLDDAMQDSSLKVIIDRKISVTEFKDVVGRYAYKISDAIFDCSPCSSCTHNSSQTSDLFDTSLGDGRCMNRKCYDQKTTEAIRSKVESLREDFPAVWLDSEKAPEDRAFLSREGDSGIGREQFDACKGCDHYGAIVATAKGKEGMVTKNVCFQVSCHKQMTQAFQKKQEEAQAEPIKLIGIEAGNAPSVSQKPPKSKAKASVVPKRVLAYADKVHCEIATKAVVDSTKMVKVFALLALVKEYGHVDSTSIIAPVLDKYGEQVSSLTALVHDRSKMVSQLSHAEDAMLDELTAVFAAGIAGEKGGDNPHHNTDYMKTVNASLVATNSVMDDHWQINAEYLGNLTIAQIDMSMSASGFINWYEKAHGEGSYKKDFTGRRNARIDKIMAAGYDWKGHIPTPMRIKA